MDCEMGGERQEFIADPDKCAPLIPMAEQPEHFDQSTITDAELAAAEAATAKRRTVKRVPKGTSEYQAHWIAADDEEPDDDDDDDGMDADDNSVDSGSIDSESELESIASGDSADTAMMTDVSELNERREKEELEKLRSEREHKMFPDEIDTPMDTAARLRFIRYRPVADFKVSRDDKSENNAGAFHPDDNLPPEYRSICQFENFFATRHRVLKCSGASDCGALVEPGQYVELHIKLGAASAVQLPSPLIVTGLLEHEQRATLVHCVVRKQCDRPVASKERLIAQVGFRRFIVRPIYSEHSGGGTMHKFERFMPSASHCVASFYAPVQYPPAPVVLWPAPTESSGPSSSSARPIAIGSVLSCEPRRITLKRIVLSGHPYRTGQRSAVVRFMFFNREDIDWYRRAPLSSKFGRRGEIVEPLGTHGHMKCRFSAPLPSDDTVLMRLYKRVFPKWHAEKLPIGYTPKFDDDDAASPTIESTDVHME